MIKFDLFKNQSLVDELSVAIDNFVCGLSEEIGKLEGLEDLRVGSCTSDYHFVAKAYLVSTKELESNYDDHTIRISIRNIFDKYDLVAREYEMLSYMIGRALSIPDIILILALHEYGHIVHYEHMRKAFPNEVYDELSYTTKCQPDINEDAPVQINSTQLAVNALPEVYSDFFVYKYFKKLFNSKKAELLGLRLRMYQNVYMMLREK